MPRFLVADVVTFDNSYSYVRSKKVHYLIDLLTPGTTKQGERNAKQTGFEAAGEKQQDETTIDK